MKSILSSARSRAAERYAMDKCRVDLADLVTLAADALAKAVLAHKPHNNVVILCGKGMNGADGFMLARRLKDANLSPAVLSPFSKRDLTGGGFAVADCEFGVTSLMAKPYLEQADVVVDCLFGTGFHGTLDENIKAILELCKGHYTIAADVPSGVDPDTGSVASGAAVADETVVFTTYKPYCFLYPAKTHAGVITLADIGVPREAIREQTPSLFLTDDSVLDLVKPKAENGHKGLYGSVRIVCGSRVRSGACLLAVSGALFSGAGLVRVAAQGTLRRLVQTTHPEAVHEPRFSHANVTCNVIGCGLGKMTALCMPYYTRKKTPCVFDADALSYLASHPHRLEDNDTVHVLTPHPLEMARLTGLTVKQVEADRINIARDYAVRTKCVVVLKGHHTVVAMPTGVVYLNNTGSNALAKGGSGDVLAGLIGGLIARGLAPEAAALVGVYVHGKAADDLAEKASPTAVLPSRLAERAAFYLK